MLSDIVFRSFIVNIRTYVFLLCVTISKTTIPFAPNKYIFPTTSLLFAFLSLFDFSSGHIHVSEWLVISDPIPFRNASYRLFLALTTPRLRILNLPTTDSNNLQFLVSITTQTFPFRSANLPHKTLSSLFFTSRPTTLRLANFLWRETLSSCSVAVGAVIARSVRLLKSMESLNRGKRRCSPQLTLRWAVHGVW